MCEHAWIVTNEHAIILSNCVLTAWQKVNEHILPNQMKFTIFEVIASH